MSYQFLLVLQGIAGASCLIGYSWLAVNCGQHNEPHTFPYCILALAALLEFVIFIRRRRG